MSLLNGWIIAWLVLWAASASIYGMRKSTGIGLYMYASEQYCQGTRMYYGRDEVPEDGSNFEPFAYPPLMVLPTVALVPFPDVLQRILWAGINAGLLVLGIFAALFQGLLPGFGFVPNDKRYPVPNDKR